MGVFDKLLFGVGGTDRDKERVDSSNDWTNGSGQYGTLYQTAGCPVQCTPYSFGSQGFNVVSLMSLPNFMEGAGGSYPMVLPALNVRAADRFPQEPQRQAESRSTAPPLRAWGRTRRSITRITLPQVNPFNSYAVTEKTVSGLSGGGFRRDPLVGQRGPAGGAHHDHRQHRVGRAGLAVDTVEHARAACRPGTCNTGPRRRSAQTAATRWRCRR